MKKYMKWFLFVIFHEALLLTAITYLHKRIESISVSDWMCIIICLMLWFVTLSVIVVGMANLQKRDLDE